MDSPSPAAPDPYAEVVPYWRRHPVRTQAAAAALLTVILAVISFPPFRAPEFAYAMLVPGIFWAYQRPAFRVYAFTMLAAQAVAWTILLGWLHNVTWAGLLLLGPFTGVWVGLWYLAAWWAMPRIAGNETPVRLLSMLGLAGAWVVIEWTRTWFLTGFPWLPLSASQWERPSILQVAAFTGGWGVSFVLVAANIGFGAYAHRLFRERHPGLGKRSQEFFLALFLLLACLTLYVQETYRRGDFVQPLARIAVVQPDVPQELKWDAQEAPRILANLQSSTLTALVSSPEIIILPEAVTPIAIRGDGNAREWIEGIGRRAGVPLVLGSIAREPGAPGGEDRWYNGVFVVEPETGVQTDYYAKRHLVAFGEYMPLKPLLGWLRKVVPIGDDFLPGDDPSPLITSAGRRAVTLGPLLCFEDTFPGLARDTAALGAEVLVVLTNNAWFGRGGAAYQHAAHSVIRAVETRRPVIRVGNAGWSGWIDEFGNIREVVTNTEGSIYFGGTRTIAMTHDSRWATQDSFYVKYGDWWVAVSALLAAMTFALLGPRRSEGEEERDSGGDDGDEATKV